MSLSKARLPQEFHGALRRQLASFDQLQREVLAKTGSSLACGDGCAFCCHLRVDVRAPEVFLLAEHIRTRFAPADQAALTERLAAHSKKITAMTPLEHVTQNIACPMLGPGGRCTVYAARPHSCRRCHSTDLAACEFVFQNPDDLKFPGAQDKELFRTLSEVMELNAGEYEALGFDTRIYELGSALHEALTSPACWGRWKDRKKTFLHASMTPSH